MKNKQRVITITQIKKFGRHQLGNIGYPYKRKRSYLCIEGRDGILSTSDKDVIRALTFSGFNFDEIGLFYTPKAGYRKWCRIKSKP